RAVREAHDHGLLQDSQRLHLPRHTPTAAARGLTGCIDARQPGAQLLVGRELVEETALEPAAVAEQPGVRQRHLLRLGHLHRDRLELAQVRGAAELAPAWPDAVHDLRRVARADLAHLDAGVELARSEEHTSELQSRLELVS